MMMTTTKPMMMIRCIKGRLLNVDDEMDETDQHDDEERARTMTIVMMFISNESDVYLL